MVTPAAWFYVADNYSAYIILTLLILIPNRWYAPLDIGWRRLFEVSRMSELRFKVGLPYHIYLKF